MLLPLKPKISHGPIFQLLINYAADHFAWAGGWRADQCL